MSNTTQTVYGNFLRAQNNTYSGQPITWNGNGWIYPTTGSYITTTSISTWDNIHICMTCFVPIDFKSDEPFYLKRHWFCKEDCYYQFLIDMLRTGQFDE